VLARTKVFMASAVPFESSDNPAPLSPARADSDPVLHFLAGGGEMGERMRSFDWTKTPLGAPSAWPQSLKTIVRMMLDSRYAMWMLWGPELTFFCNDAYLPTVGLKRDWVLGARSDKVWAEIWPDIGPRIEHVLAHGEATWDEALRLYLERSGFTEETYHTFSYSPVYDEDNRIAGMLCVVTEVTERVVNERRLRALSDLASHVARGDRVDETCERASDVFAQYPADVPFAAFYLLDGGIARRVAQTGADGSPALPPALALDAVSPWPIAALIADEAPREVRDLGALGVAIAAGEWPDRVQRAMLLPLKSAGHGLAGFLIAGVSPRRPFDDEYRSFLDLVAGQIAAAVGDAQAYQSERRRAEALAELDRAKTAFFSNVSHELRTPLTLMLGPLHEALGDARLPAALREQLELAERNAVRLQRLVNSLLDFSRIEAGRVQAGYVRTDLSALTRDVASTFRSAMERAGLDFSVDCAPLDEDFAVDRDMWEKIVLNLLSNAFKFTLAGRVAVRLRGERGAAVLEVEDSGVGIPEAELPRLFERFHRVQTTQGRTHEGSGIGLALVQELVRLHGGTIEATSRLGEGSTFRVRVPSGLSHLPKESVRDAPVQGLSASSAFVEEALRWLPEPDAPVPALIDAESIPVADRRFAATFGARVVLADDNADMRAYVRGLLAPFYAVEAVANGAEALAAAQRATPELILSDVMMPGLDGFGLLAAVRRDPALQSIPVVLLSARAGEESRIEGLDSGADDYIVKPFSARELLARVGGLLELRRMRRFRAAQFETLLNEAPLGVFLVDSKLRLRDANPTARATMGDIPDLVGRDIGEILLAMWPEPHASEVTAQFRRTLATGAACFMPECIEVRRDRGATEYYEWQISRIPLPDGQNGVVCYFRDISQHVQARLLLESADRQKDEFLAMLAHELRNPLAPIRNAGEVLSRLELGEPRAEQAVGVVQRQITTLTRLVDDLLDVSRITRGRVELQMKPVQLSDVVAQAVEMVEPLVKEKHQRLSTTTYRALRVQGDPARLVQCVANMLTNAAKYTDEGGAIQLELREDGGDALVSVTDNGIGIPPELQSRVFDLFVQGERALDRAQGGLGIGLSVVKRLVEMHGGSIAVHSEGQGRGSRFEMRLPLLERVAPAEVHAPAVEVTPRRILVVDDNEDAADSLTMVLQLDGHEVACAYTAEDALVLAPKFRPDVALLDVGLPRMDGYELAQRMRALPGFERVHLVALTGYGQPGDRERALAAGFDSHLVKPAEYRTLQQIIERVRT
jgi:PAS domain S-box-containing protein